MRIHLDRGVGYFRGSVGLTRGICAAAVIAAVGVMVPVNGAEAAPVYWTPAERDGVRFVTETDNQLNVFGEHPSGDQWVNASISWEITPVPGQTLLEYTYTFTNFGPPAISHLTLDISPDAVNEDELLDSRAILDAEVSQNGDGLGFVLEFGSNDGISSAVKFEGFDPEHEAGQTLVISFLSNRLPVWGDVFMTGGELELVNAGLRDHSALRTSDFIAVPNSAIPTPTAAMGGLALLGVLAARRPRRRARV